MSPPPSTDMCKGNGVVANYMSSASANSFAIIQQHSFSLLSKLFRQLARVGCLGISEVYPRYLVNRDVLQWADA